MLQGEEGSEMEIREGFGFKLCEGCRQWGGLLRRPPKGLILVTSLNLIFLDGLCTCTTMFFYIFNMPFSIFIIMKHYYEY